MMRKEEPLQVHVSSHNTLNGVSDGFLPSKLPLELLKQVFLNKHVTLTIFDNPETIKLEGKLVDMAESFHDVCRELVLKQDNHVMIVRGKGINIATQFKVKQKCLTN